MDATREPRTIQPDDLFHLKFLQGAQLSPDGKTIVYAVSHIEPSAGPDTVEEREYVTLWLLSVEMGQTRQLTNGLARDTNPQWSPDGKHIAFRSTRGGTQQIYLISVDGGEARALTAMKQGVGGGPVWSPDGKLLAFTAGPVGERPDPKKPYRLTRPLVRFDGLGYLHNVVQDLFVISATGGEAQQLTADEWMNSAPRWSPDGQELLYTASLGPDGLQGFRPKLRVVNLRGESRELVGEWGYASSGTWTPDGERIVFVGAPYSCPFGIRTDLWVIGRHGGEPVCRSADLKFGVGGFLQLDMPALWDNWLAPKILVTRDSTTAYLQVQNGGTLPIYRVALTGPESWAPVVDGERSCFLLDADDRQLLFAGSTLSNPVDLFVANLNGSNERQVTLLNADLLTKRSLPTVEHLVFPSVDETKIEGWVLKPCVGTAPYPTILYIHGGPHLGFGHVFSFDFQMLAGAGYAVLFVNQRGSTGYGDAFASQIFGDWGNLDYQDLMAGVDYVIAKGIADPKRLGCCGLSGGGYLTCWIVGHTDRFKAAVPENPVTNWLSFYGTSDIGPWFAAQELGGPPHEIPEVYRRCSPVTYAHRCTTPTLLVQGEHDYRCPAEQSEQFYTVLKANGCMVEMLRFPESPHIGSIAGALPFRRFQNEALLDWMNRYV